MSDSLGDTIRDVWNKLTFNDPNVKKAKQEMQEEEDEKKRKKVAVKDPDAVKDRGGYVDKKVKEAGG